MYKTKHSSLPSRAFFFFFFLNNEQNSKRTIAGVNIAPFLGVWSIMIFMCHHALLSAKFDIDLDKRYENGNILIIVKDFFSENNYN